MMPATLSHCASKEMHVEYQVIDQVVVVGGTSFCSPVVGVAMEPNDSSAPTPASVPIAPNEKLSDEEQTRVGQSWLSHPLLCFAMLCYAMLCYAML